jgi:hypothetical protein
MRNCDLSVIRTINNLSQRHLAALVGKTETYIRRRELHEDHKQYMEIDQELEEKFIALGYWDKENKKAIDKNPNKYGKGEVKNRRLINPEWFK